MQPTFQTFLLVACGGAIGSIARYGVALSAQRLSIQLPIGTFTANLIGCFLIGVISQIAVNTTMISPAVRLFLIAGFCGGFTTFSTFAFEIVGLIDGGHLLYALVYAVLSVLLGILAIYVGIWIIKAVL
ncbi:MAG: fluoride efflux transporter CrcB [Ignavibacteria bacterium]|nr:fluoride efflux transporter CrcB [Ignavibacteria bacterium]